MFLWKWYEDTTSHVVLYTQIILFVSVLSLINFKLLTFLTLLMMKSTA
jgi:hypothetical protein